ncbi:MAG: hypothetical protein GC164_08385 [Phycisphaera sp.]|nr:hypothetical protein [Phycisphaera sp.]
MSIRWFGVPEVVREYNGSGQLQQVARATGRVGQVRAAHHSHASVTRSLEYSQANVASYQQ